MDPGSACYKKWPSMKRLVLDGYERLLKWHTLRQWLNHPVVAQRVETVLALDGSEEGLSTGVGEPRSLPGNPEFRASGWSDHMLLRYLLVLAEARGNRILDSCCGLGWGTHLISWAAGAVTGVDLDPNAIQFCSAHWGADNTRFEVASVLDLPFEDGSFDVVLCMESIEHFTEADGRRYIAELRRVCRPGGVLLGSSAFVETRVEADRLCSGNPHHHYVYTRAEFWRLLSELFGRPELLTRHYFRARRAADSSANPQSEFSDKSEKSSF